ncbi:MAG: electron transfer flavoprotein subunit beta/FixA family protein [Sulfobacillus sp.]
MQILVLVKQVPDTATRIKIDADGKDIQRDGLTLVLNPYDEYAVEEALLLKELHGGTVTVLTLGPAKADEALRSALAMGADEAVRVDGQPADALQAGWALAQAAKALAPDLILCGKQAVDDDQAEVGVLVAEFLNVPQVTVAVSLSVDPAAHSGQAKREVEGGVQQVAFSLPAVVTAQKGLNEPRYPSLPGIMKAKRKEIAVQTADLGIAAGVELVGLTPPAPRKAGTLLKDLPGADAGRELVRLLHEDAKAI